MRKIGFVVDSTFGYNGNEAIVVPLNVFLGEREFVDGQIENQAIVDALTKHERISTSQPSPSLFLEAYEKLLESYEHVICLTISKSLSGTFNSANLAKDMLETNNVTVIDTETIAVGALDILEKTLEFANDNQDLDAVLEKIELLKSKGSIIFSVDDLSTLVRNGRLGRISGFIGNVLKIKPILRFKQGVLDVEAKVRGLLGAFKYIVNQVSNLVLKDRVDVKITYVDNEGYANRLLDMIAELNNENINAMVCGSVSPVVSAHIGLGGMGIYLTTI